MDKTINQKRMLAVKHGYLERKAAASASPVPRLLLAHRRHSSMTILIEHAMKDWLHNEATALGVSVSDIVAEGIHLYLESKGMGLVCSARAKLTEEEWDALRRLLV